MPVNNFRDVPDPVAKPYKKLNMMTAGTFVTPNIANSRMLHE